jgi:hypothetical protein
MNLTEDNLQLLWDHLRCTCVRSTLYKDEVKHQPLEDNEYGSGICPVTPLYICVTHKLLLSGGMS